MVENLLEAIAFPAKYFYRYNFSLRSSRYHITFSHRMDANLKFPLKHENKINKTRYRINLGLLSEQNTRRVEVETILLRLAIYIIYCRMILLLPSNARTLYTIKTRSRLTLPLGRSFVLCRERDAVRCVSICCYSTVTTWLRST